MADHHKTWMILYLISALAVEAGYLFLPGRILIWTSIKVAVFISLFLYVSADTVPKSRIFSSFGAIALCFYAVADISISCHLIVGGILYAVGHLFLLWGILRKSRMHISSLLIWILFSVLLSVMIPIFFHSQGIFSTGIILYGIILLSVLIGSFDFSERLRVGTIAFFLSDLFLAFQLLMHFRFLQISGIILFYLSLLIISESVRIGEI